jgi:hypothetical protein
MPRAAEASKTRSESRVRILKRRRSTAVDRMRKLVLVYWFGRQRAPRIWECFPDQG